MSALLWLALALAQDHLPDGTIPDSDEVAAEVTEELVPEAAAEEAEAEAEAEAHAEADVPFEEPPPDPVEPEPLDPEPAPVQAEPRVVRVPDYILEYGPFEPVPAPTAPPMDFVGPMPQPDNAPVVVLPPTPAPVEQPWIGDVLPWVAFRGFGPGLFLLFLAGLSGSLSVVLGRMESRLHATGVLPQFAKVGAAASRVLAAFFLLGAVGAWIPASIAPALPWLIVGAALAVGWSARDFLPDLMAFVVMRLEGRVREGRWVHGAGFRGEVQWVGPRATIVLDEQGGEVTLPNRVLVSSPFARDPSEWPRVDVSVQLPPNLDSSRARRALRDAVLLSPWVAPGALEIHADTDGNGIWSVSVRLLEGTYLAQFEGSLRERVSEVLGQ